ncbi:hypothetical protein [Lysinibacillus sp. RC79]|uniref:flagellin N-terminal helical domain-containing protein n=1 Tax=Lysinibacillus sp. RC79 TaxID=3156296 RepID=UPI0035129AE7
MIIRHNIASLNTNNRLTQTKKKADSVLEKLSSGYKINRAGDDAAGLAISEKMRGQIRGLNMAGKNIQDGISLIETAESGLGSIQDPNLLRLRELAIQAANDTLTDLDRQQIQQEVEQIKSGIDAIANNTEFNGIKLLNNNSSSEIKSGTTESNIIWKTIQTGAHGNFQSIIASSDKLIAVSSQGEIAMSTDGENWTVTNLPSPLSLLDAYWDGNKFFAVGSRQTVIYSTDGMNWDYGITGGSHYFYSINEKNGIYMASGNAGIAYSNDGTTWTYQDPNLNQATSEISKNNNEFIWLKGTNFIRTSTDGVNWTDKPYLPTHINSISWNGSIHVAVGANGAIITSSDLSNWDSQISNTPNNINEVVFDGSKFVATAEDTVLYSYNGTDWKSSTTTPGMILDTVSFNDQFISVGHNGKIFVGAKDIDSSQFENSNNKEIQLQVGANSN